MASTVSVSKMKPKPLPYAVWLIELKTTFPERLDTLVEELKALCDEYDMEVMQVVKFYEPYDE